MKLTIAVCATVARSRISKIEICTDRGLNAEAQLLNVGADFTLPNGYGKDSRCVQAIIHAHVYTLLIDAHGNPSCVDVKTLNGS